MKKGLLLTGLLLIMVFSLTSCKLVDKLKEKKESTEATTNATTMEEEKEAQEKTEEVTVEERNVLELSGNILEVNQNNVDELFKLEYRKIFELFKGEYTEDYYNGAKYVSFQESNVALLFNEIDFDNDKIKENAKVVGVMMGGKSTAFGIRQGMYPPEIKSILGKPKSEGEDLSGEGFDWGMDYEISNYWLHFGMDGENQPIQSIEIYPLKN